MPVVEQYLLNFGKRPVPRILRRLLSLFLNPALPWPWDIELVRVDNRTINHLVVGDDSGRGLVPIGQTGSGSIFAIWEQPGLKLEDSPVVYVDTEGIQDCVLAKNLDAFIDRMALGDPSPNTPDETNEDELYRFRNWLEQVENRTVTKATIQDLQDEAEYAYPNFRAWLNGDVEEITEFVLPKYSTLVEAVTHGDLDQFKDKIGDTPNFEDKEVKQSIEQAIIEGKKEIIELFLSLGMPIDLRLCSFDNTPLLTAATCDNLELVRLFLEYGADPFVVNEIGENLALLGFADLELLNKVV